MSKVAFVRSRQLKIIRKQAVFSEGLVVHLHYGGGRHKLNRARLGAIVIEKGTRNQYPADLIYRFKVTYRRRLMSTFNKKLGFLFISYCVIESLGLINNKNEIMLVGF